MLVAIGSGGEAQNFQFTYVDRSFVHRQQLRAFSLVMAKADMNIAITGATGFVGQSLVPILQQSGRVELVLIGRDVKKIQAIFPDAKCCQYDDMATYINDFDVLLHLAVLNNNCPGSAADFYYSNVELLSQILNDAKKSNIQYIVNISSLHALDDTNKSNYAISKRKALQLLDEKSGIKKINFFLPVVYGNKWSGSLKFLNTLPKYCSSLIFQVLSASKPTVDIRRIAVKLLELDINYDGQDQIITDGQLRNPFFAFVKRATDLSFAVTTILLFWWLMVLVWVAIQLESKGPGIFAQERIGRHASAFTCYKFRTMKQGTEQVGTHDVSTYAVTKLGKFLRRTKLDELPQVWNILRNEMSLIGPRPCLPMQRELIEQRKARGIYDVKPGITGLAQVNDIDMSNAVQLAQWDSRYIKLQSLLADLQILLLTLTGRGNGDRVALVTSPEYHPPSGS